MAPVSGGVRRAGAFAALVLALALARGTEAASAPAMEYQVKAVFLYNFTQFVDWPADAFDKPDAPLVIGILGEDPFEKFLDDVVRGEKAGGHPIVIKRFRDIDSARDCHLLFVGGAEPRRLDTVMSVLKDRMTLT